MVRGNAAALTSARGSSRCSARSRAEIRGGVSRWADPVISCQSDESWSVANDDPRFSRAILQVSCAMLRMN